MVDFRMTEIENINSPIKKLDNKTLRELIMDMQTCSGEKYFSAIKKSWQVDYVLWAKHKFKGEAAVYASYSPSWLIELCGNELVSKLDPIV